MSATREHIINSWKNEWIYALVIDRFHDGKARTTSDASSRKGFGTSEELRRFCGGNLNGIRQKLPYIKELGCTSILLTPFLENNPETYHGYAIQDFLNVDERFGSLEDLQALVHEAHAMGLRVIMDVVLNHTGNNWSYKEARTLFRKKKPYTFSHWRYEDKPQPLALRNEAWYSKRGSIKHWDNYPESWDGDLFELKDLKWTEDTVGLEVLECMVGIYAYWIEASGVDGFRLDALKHIRPVMANEFCRRIQEEALRLGKPDFLLIGEVVGGEALIELYSGVQGYFEFPFYFRFLHAIVNQTMYDTLLTIPPPIDSFLPVYYLDNHDQIGLEPKKRISDLLSDEQVAGSLLLMGLLPGIQCLYYGTEQGLRTEGEKDHDIRECLFDAKGDTDLFRSEYAIYQGVQRTIATARELKKNVTSFSAVVFSTAVHGLVGYVEDVQRYKVVINTSLEEQAMPSVIGRLVYSNYKESDVLLLFPFEIRVYAL